MSARPTAQTPLDAAGFNDLQVGLREQIRRHDHQDAPLAGSALSPQAALRLGELVVQELHVGAVELGARLGALLPNTGGAVARLGVAGEVRVGEPMTVAGAVRPTPNTPSFAGYDADTDGELRWPAAGEWVEVPRLSLRVSLAEAGVVLAYAQVEAARARSLEGDAGRSHLERSAPLWVQPFVVFVSAPSVAFPAAALARLDNPHDPAAWVAALAAPGEAAGLMVPTCTGQHSAHHPVQTNLLLALPLPAGHATVSLRVCGMAPNLRRASFTLTLLPR